jgi:lipid-binding SYLF domain-containing protein
MRTGLHWSGAGGSGVLISRLPNGQWSPPSGIVIHTLGWGFMAGADIYDCVCVINNAKGMEGFTRVRGTLGGEISAAVGPLGAGGVIDSEVFARQAPVWTYTKSKGLYLGVQVDGTVIVERTGVNERFYGVENIRHKQILAGEVQPPVGTVVQLWETLQAIEGHAYDTTKIPPPYVKSPGDLEVEPPKEESFVEYGKFADSGERMDVK